jgi:hypothetical protein
LISQKALKENISNFVQNHDAIMALIDSLNTSLETLLEIVAINFVGAKHSSIKIVKSCKMYMFVEL